MPEIVTNFYEETEAAAERRHIERGHAKAMGLATDPGWRDCQAGACVTTSTSP